MIGCSYFAHAWWLIPCRKSATSLSWRPTLTSLARQIRFQLFVYTHLGKQLAPGASTPLPSRSLQTLRSEFRLLHARSHTQQTHNSPNHLNASIIFITFRNLRQEVRPWLPIQLAYGLWLPRARSLIYAMLSSFTLLYRFLISLPSSSRVDPETYGAWLSRLKWHVSEIHLQARILERDEVLQVRPYGEYWSVSHWRTPSRASAPL